MKKHLSPLVKSLFFLTWICLGLSVQADDTSCKTCHTDQHQSWEGSHHQLAMAPVGPETVRGDFNDASIDLGQAKAQFYTRDGNYYCKTENEKGEMTEYKISHVFGWTPLQQYLVQMATPEPGTFPKTQCLPWAWDDEKLRWYHLYDHDLPVPGEPIHWTGWGQNWNHMCADCHVTHYEKDFDATSKTFASSFSIGHVSCSACHSMDDQHGKGDRYIAGKGMKPLERIHPLADLDKAKQSAEIQSCAPCHALRGHIKGGFRSGDTFEDHYALNPLTEDQYHHDGQIKGEVYVVGSFLQSKMYNVGVRCSHCHDPHSLELRLPQEQVCTQCHAPETYAAKSHHFHDPKGPGANCLECHMPESIYMGIDRRRDHSMRIPRPDLSQKISSINACTGCHLEPNRQRQAGDYPLRLSKALDGDAENKALLKKTDEAMTKAFLEWYGPQDPNSVGEVFHGSRRGQSVQPELLKIAKDALKHGPITRATALLELTAIGAQVDHRDLSELIQDPDPMVRRHAAPLLTRRSDLKALLNDPVRSVRLDALRQVMSPAGRISPEGWEAELKARWPDVLGMLDANADQAGAHVLKAQVHQALGEMEQAMASFQTGIEVQPELTGARTQLAQIHADAGREKEALALWKDEIAAIETTLELVTDEPSLWYQLGLLQYRCKLERDTIRSMKVVLKLQPNHYNAGAFVIQLSQRLQRWRDVKDAAKTLLNHFPQDQWLQQTFMDASRR